MHGQAIPDFDYRAVLKSDMSGEITSLIAHQVSSNSPLRAVIWSVPRKAWISAPAPAARFLYDEQYFDRTRKVDRPTAEQIARDLLHTELPSEQTLRAMIDEGDRMGWDYGPPRQ